MFMKYVCKNKKEALFNKPNLSIFTENLMRVPLKIKPLKIVDFFKNLSSYSKLDLVNFAMVVSKRLYSRRSFFSSARRIDSYNKNHQCARTEEG